MIRSSRVQSRFYSLILLILISVGMACQATARPGLFVDTGPPVEGSRTRQPSPAWTLTPTRDPATPTRTASPTPTASPAPTASPTPQPTPPAYQLEVFDELWDVVKDEYLYRDFNGLDWEATRLEFQARIAAGLSDAAFYATMDELVERLNDDHSFFHDPTEVFLEEATYAGERSYEGIGVLVAPVPARNRAVVLVIFPDSPAAAAGIRPRDSILAVDGLPILNPEGVLRDLLRGPDGSSIQLLIQTPRELPRELELTRTSVTGPLPLSYEMLESSVGRRIGYVLLPNFSDGTIDEQLAEALQAMARAGGVDGLILDNRWNRGGVDTVLRGSLMVFVQGLLGHFVNAEGRRPLLVRGEDIQGSQELPLVVLVGPDTASFGEIFAGVLQDLARAYLIGEPTRGNVETMWGYDFVDGSRAWIAHDSFQPLNDPSQDWERDGVIPDEIVQAPWEAYPLPDDPLVLVALDYFDR